MSEHQQPPVSADGSFHTFGTDYVGISVTDIFALPVEPPPVRTNLYCPGGSWPAIEPGDVATFNAAGAETKVAPSGPSICSSTAVTSDAKMAETMYVPPFKPNTAVAAGGLAEN
jgi:hypothetical protein